MLHSTLPLPAAKMSPLIKLNQTDVEGLLILSQQATATQSREYKSRSRSEQGQQFEVQLLAQLYGRNDNPCNTECTNAGMLLQGFKEAQAPQAQAEKTKDRC